MMTPREFEREQWAYWTRDKQRQKDIIRAAWWGSSLHPMRRRNLPSLSVLTDPVRPVKGEEKERLDKEFKEMEAWALSVPVRPIVKGEGGRETPGQARDTNG
jgi:hypothetical protein